ncbi:RNase H family protein [Amnibacterium sp. CER49]|uniref:RNase H family protein n=1 Tax=Amnibacterium sp. CER49 TaxID=3039161 RepID=UPI003264629E
MTITAAADGSALGNPGPAGWAWYIDDEAWAAGGWKHGTNNMGELKAVLELFRATEGVDDDLLVLCDSQYVINAATKWMAGWKRKGWRKADGKPVMNVDLLQELDEALAGRRYRFEWVRGHVGHPLNEAADERARAVATAYQRGAAVPTGPGFPARRGGTAPAVRPGPASASPAPPAPAPSAALFDLGEPDAARVVPVGLTADEWQRLERIAREAGLPADEVLRGLVRDALRPSRRARSAG